MKFQWIEIHGLRAFGTETRRITIGEHLTVINGGNSTGKSSIAEAVDFLLTGATGRRELHEGSRAEFSGALRNAYVDASEPVWVAAGLLRDDGSTLELRRDLVSDYVDTADCASTLTADGTVIKTVEEIGIALGTHRAPAPVLQQHTLRHIVAAAPQERADYFKELLSISDLEIVRRIITREISRLEAQNHGPRMAALNQLLQVAAYKKQAAALAKSLNIGQASKALHQMLDIALAAAGVKPLSEDISSKVVALKKVIVELEAAVFPAAILTADRLEEATSADIDVELKGYDVAVNAVEAEVAHLMPVFQAVLATPSVAEFGHEHPPIDCPVCGTAGALTPARIAAMRKQLLDVSDVGKVSGVAKAAISRLKGEHPSLTDQVGTSIPKVINLPDEEMAKVKTGLSALGVSGELTAPLLSAVPELKSAYDNNETAATALRDVLTGVGVTITTKNIIGEAKLEEVSNLVTRANNARQRLYAALETYCDAYEPTEVSARTLIEKASGTTDLAGLAIITENATQTMVDIRRARAHKKVQGAIKKAKNDVDAAFMSVMDAKFAEMSAEVKIWWDSLRPDELVRFDSVRPRGQGKRFIDVKAVLSAAPGDVGTLRDAVGIFSESQMCALGVASFIAKSRMEHTPFVVLDDPIPSGDEDHTHTFAYDLIPKLLATGTQVIVTVFDTKLAQQIDGYAATYEPAYYRTNLADLSAGTEVIEVSDEFQHRLQKARAILHSADTETRELAGAHLRKAAERLAKQIIVANVRTGGGEAVLEDYAGKNLGELAPIAITYASDANEPGKWTALGRELNPANHDGASPPTPIALRQACATLVEISKAHPEAKGIR